MNPDDRKRRFNEAIVNMLFPSSPQSEPELEPAEPLIDDSASDVISGAILHTEHHALTIARMERNIVENVGTLDDGYDNSSTSVDEERDSETEKLSRAQRKKIRKKKLNEEAVRRGKLIGPLLPLTTTQVARDAPPVRSNASEEGVEAACGKSVKVKHRRMAKRLAKRKGMATTSDNTNQSSPNDLKEARL